MSLHKDRVLQLYAYPHTKLDNLISTGLDNPGIPTGLDNPGISTGLDIFLNKKDNPSVCWLGAKAHSLMFILLESVWKVLVCNGW